MMRTCLRHADELQAEGKLVGFQQLEDAHTAKSVRIRSGRTSVVDGPFAETKKILGGFNLNEADDMDEAVRIASEFTWARTGCIAVRPGRGRSEERRVGKECASTGRSRWSAYYSTTNYDYSYTCATTHRVAVHVRTL